MVNIMKNFDTIRLASAVAIVLAVSAAPVFAEDLAMPPTGNYVAPPATTTITTTTQSLGTLNKTDMTAMPKQLPVPPGAMPLPVNATPPSPASMPPQGVAAMPAKMPMQGVTDSSDVLQPKKVGDVTYITGGIGEEERNTLTQTKKDYNLQVMSADKTGHYVSDTQLVIRDKKGAEVLSVPMGPLFYAKLPAGSYAVEASSAGQTQKENITIHGNEASNVDFNW